MDSKKYILMGIGNILRGDDGIGSIIAQKFKDHDWLSLDCGVAPENFTSIIKKNRPNLLVLIDVVEMGLEPGQYRIIPPEKIDIMHLTTHSISLSFLISYLKNFARETVFIGIQPKFIDYSTFISPEILKSADKIMRILKDKKLNTVKKL